MVDKVNTVTAYPPDESYHGLAAAPVRYMARFERES